MRKIISVIIIMLWAIIMPCNIIAQVFSSKSSLSLPSSTLINDASCIGYHINNWTTFYMRDNDSSYLCNSINDALWAPLSTPFKVPLSQDIIIKDFKRFSSYHGFIGSYQNVGMYGKTMGSLNVYNNLQLFTLSAVDRLDRIATIRASAAVPPFQIKAYAIGSKLFSKADYQNFILEFYAIGVGALFPYYYAPLAYDPITSEQEIADDVITSDHYVVFATRDTRRGHAPINLRISDTTSALCNNEIDFQWQYMLPSNERLISKVRLLPLEKDFFIMAYTILNINNGISYLCYHRIKLIDLLAGNNTIVSHEVQINSDCGDLIDLIYEPDVNTMVLLLNGNNQSKLYHADPNSVINDDVYKLDYPNGNLYSIDTLGTYLNQNADMYVAMGGKKVFCQDISNGYVINLSCLEISKVKSWLRIPPSFEIFHDPIGCSHDSKYVINIEGDSSPLDCWRECFEIEEDKSNH